MVNPSQYRVKKEEAQSNPSKVLEKNGFRHKAPKSEGMSTGTMVATILLFFGAIYFIASSNDKDISKKKEEIRKSAKQSGLVIKEDPYQLALFARDKYQLTTEEVCLLSDIASKAAPGLPGGYGAKNVLSALMCHPEYIGRQADPEVMHRDLKGIKGESFGIEDAVRLHQIFTEFNSRASEETKTKIIRNSMAFPSQNYECW